MKVRTIPNRPRTQRGMIALATLTALFAGVCTIAAAPVVATVATLGAIVTCALTLVALIDDARWFAKLERVEREVTAENAKAEAAARRRHNEWLADAVERTGTIVAAKRLWRRTVGRRTAADLDADDWSRLAAAAS